MKRRYSRRSELGVTITEMMMAMAINGLLLAAVVSSFSSQQRSYVVQTQIADMTANARTALDRLIRDIRQAGYGLASNDWSDWVDWVEDANGNPVRFSDPVTIASHDDEPHQIMLIGAFGAPVAHLTGKASTGDTELHLKYASGVSKLNSRTRYLIYIGRNELARVTDSQARQKRIRIDTDPHRPGKQGLAWDYVNQPSQCPIELISVLTYKVVMDERHDDAPTPVLKRDANTGGGAQPLAEHIEDLRFTRDGDMLTVTLTARTSAPDPRYTHPQAQDGYRRLTLTSTVRLRG
jgi:type II secretory pathway pseudopilin PulG